MNEVFLYFCIAKAFGAWCSWLAFLHGVQAVARSSRAAPTSLKNPQKLITFEGFVVELA